MRMTSPPMLLGRKLLKNSRDEIRAEQRPPTHLDVLRVQQELPAPRAGQHVDGVDGQRDGEPDDRCLAGTRPQTRGVDAPE